MFPMSHTVHDHRLPTSQYQVPIQTIIPDYAELHCKTNYTFLEGASHPEELIQKAAECDYHALAITDRNSLAGIVRAHIAARQYEIKLIIGSEMTPVDSLPAVLLPTNRTSYGQLSRLITEGRRRAPKGQCHFTFDDMAAHSKGLIALIVPSCTPSQNHPSPDHSRPLTRSNFLPSFSLDQLTRYRDVFENRCYLAAELHYGSDDPSVLEHLIHISKHSQIPLSTANDVHYHHPARSRLHDILVSVRKGCPVSEAGPYLFPNSERHIKSKEHLFQMFSEHSHIFHRSMEIADQCHFSLDELRYEYPEELCPGGECAIGYLRRLTWEGANNLYPDIIPEQIRQLLEHELHLIEELHYESYFLTVWDLVRFARSKNILCQGRGSAANSAVCYCLGITSVNPEKIDVLFERFISRERNEAPDIDIDFEHERREEVLQYLYTKYGRERAAMTAEVVRYRLRSSLRDIGKALDLSQDRINNIVRTIEHHRDTPPSPPRCPEDGLSDSDPMINQLMSLSDELMGFPRHLSQHVGGMVMTQSPLCEIVPLENASMPHRTFIEWDKEDLNELGILKVDCLSLGMLTAIHRCFDLIQKHFKTTLTLSNIPDDDPLVYDMISKADTIGVFQIESRAQMSMLPRLQPRCFYDLVIEIAIVRPGPIQGNMVHPYLRRRQGSESISYPDESIRKVLHKTLGIPIFQEQAMRLAIVAAGFTPGEADQLRRAMGGWRRPGIIDHFHKKLVCGMQHRGYSHTFSQQLFQQIRGFGEYGFPESHAASFARLVYISAWLKYHYPAAFTASILNSQPMGFYAPSQLIQHVRRSGIKVCPVDINFSSWDCTLETNLHRPNKQNISCDIRLGFRIIKGFSQSDARNMQEARNQHPFDSVTSFAHRTGFGTGLLNLLARSDTFRSLGLNRRQSLWQILSQQKPLPLFTNNHISDELESNIDIHASRPPDLPPPTLREEILSDYQHTGLSLRGHPMQFMRQHLSKCHLIRIRDLIHQRPGYPVKIAGIIICRQRPGTASGITFVTLEDETGLANLIIKPPIWNQHRSVARNAIAIQVEGNLQREGTLIHVLVTCIKDISCHLISLGPVSRDFR